MSKVLITGCSGFIGSRIAIRAKQAGYDVLASTRESCGTLEQELKMPVTTIDVLKPIPTSDDTGHIDAIIHCATANDILSRNFELGIALSVYGTRNVLEFVVNRGITKFIFFSTLQVYGTELSGAISEDSPVCCQTPYALNHYYGEELCRMYARNRDLDVVVLRPSNIFGVPDVSTVQRDSLVPMCFIKEAIQSDMITLRSSGRQQRNFISTDEVADGCFHLLSNFPKGCEVVNIGSNWLSSIHEIAEITKQVYSSRYGKCLQLKILSDEPIKGNSFTINSRISALRPAIHESKQSMIKVIKKLFENFNIHERCS